jgi:hypothetical protein
LVAAFAPEVPPIALAPIAEDARFKELVDRMSAMGDKMDDRMIVMGDKMDSQFSQLMEALLARK